MQDHRTEQDATCDATMGQFQQREARLAGEVVAIIKRQAEELTASIQAHAKQDPDGFDAREPMIMRLHDLWTELRERGAAGAAA